MQDLVNPGKFVEEKTPKNDDFFEKIFAFLLYYYFQKGGSSFCSFYKVVTF